MESVDITGTMVKPLEGWQKRTEELAKPEFWKVLPIPDPQLWDQLSEEERRRMEPKVDLVVFAAKCMLAGMVKGTVKYPTDGWTLEQWMAHIIGEGADQMNYQLLTFASFHRDLKERRDAIERTLKAWEKVDGDK